MKPKIIIIEGAQGCGKTTITNWLREQLPYTNLIRMSGHRYSDESGRDRSCKMYSSLIDYIKDLNRSMCDINIVFDRIFISDWVFCSLGYRKYNFPLLDFVHQLSDLSEYYDIIYINLFNSDIDSYKERLCRDKCETDIVKFDISESIKQQNMYIEAFGIVEKYVPSFIIDTSKPLNDVKDEISRIITKDHLLKTF